MLEIAKLQIKKTAKLLLDQQIALSVEIKALEQLAKEGYDPMYGARPLRRLVQSAIENPIATMLIQKQFIAGDTIVVDYDPAEEIYTFVKADTPQPIPPTGDQTTEKTEPVESTAEPVEPTIEPVKLTTEPVEPTTEPVKTIEPVETLTPEPTEVAESTETPAAPTPQ